MPANAQRKLLAGAKEQLLISEIVRSNRIGRIDGPWEYQRERRMEQQRAGMKIWSRYFARGANCLRARWRSLIESDGLRCAITLTRTATHRDHEKKAKNRVVDFAVSRRLSRHQTRTERDVLSVLRFDGERQRVVPPRCSSSTPSLSVSVSVSVSVFFFIPQ